MNNSGLIGKIATAPLVGEIFAALMSESVFRVTIELRQQTENNGRLLDGHFSNREVIWQIEFVEFKILTTHRVFTHA